MGPIHTFDDIKDMLRRRFWLILLLTILGAVASVFFALSRPHVYLSSEVLQIERPRITDELAPSTVEGSSARRLQLIEQQLMARDTVLEIIAKHELFANMPALSPTEKVALFRESVTIEGVERRHQLEMLQSLGVDFYQGFYLGYPAPSDQVMGLIAGDGPAQRSLSA